MTATDDIPGVLPGVVDWVQRNTGRTLNDNQARCVSVLREIAAPHNLPLIGDGWSAAVDYADDPTWGDDYELPLRAPVVFHDEFIIVRLNHQLSTFDGSELTRLVVAGHDAAVRVGISPELQLQVDTESQLSEWRRDPDHPRGGRWVETDEHPTGPGACLAVQLSARKREGAWHDSHPTLADAVARIRGAKR